MASGGRTIIEKLEAYGNVAFAVVLMTADDEGRAVTVPDNLKPRARQNVVLELGYFVGRLGRKNVCALVKDSLETPSDWDGVVYTPLDRHDGWKLTLCKELKEAGFDIDMSKVL